MKKTLRSGIMCLLLTLCLSIECFAAGEYQVGSGESKEIINSIYHTDIEGNVTEDNTTDSSSNKSGSQSSNASLTEEQQLAQSVRSSTNSSIQSIINQIKGNNTWGSYVPTAIQSAKNKIDRFGEVLSSSGTVANNNALLRFGFASIPASDLTDLVVDGNSLGYASSNVDSGNNYNNVSTPSKKLAVSKDVANNYGSVDEDLAEAIAEKEGISSSSDGSGSGGTLNSHTGMSQWTDIPGYNEETNQGTGQTYTLTFDPSGGFSNGAFLDFLARLPQFSYSGGKSGLRTDLFVGGFNDTGSLSSRINAFREMYLGSLSGTGGDSGKPYDDADGEAGSGVSNSMEDYCVMLYIEDYHVYSVSKAEVDVIDYTSDKRKWSVYKEGSSKALYSAYTDNPQHAFTFSSDQAGVYVVKAEQEARYTLKQYAYYDICDYLLDAATGNILYCNESLVSNGGGGSVLIYSEEFTGLVPTGDEFTMHVNDLGEIESDGSATHRVK